MATTIHPSPVPTPSASSPSTPPYTSFPRLPPSTGGVSISRNASTSSSKSNTTTSSSTSSLVAVPIRPPPPGTRTSATTPQQLPSRPGSVDPDLDSSSARVRYPTPGPGPGGARGTLRNGPRTRGAHPLTPNIITSLGPGSNHRERPSTAPTELSPTTPRLGRFSISQNGSQPASPSPLPLRVTISMDPSDEVSNSPLSPSRGRKGGRSIPSSPTGFKDTDTTRGKPRTLSADRTVIGVSERERRQSQVSASSTGSSHRKPSLADYILGEELGRGSYSTVVLATLAQGVNSPNPSLPPRQFAIKIIDQAHLIAEKKVKYAKIERDALIRLAQPTAMTTSASRGHRRGLSSSSSAGFPKRKSNNSIASSAGLVTGSRRNSASVTAPSGQRLSVNTDLSSSASGALTSSVPMSPALKGSRAGRRPSRSADPPEMVPERFEEHALDSPIEALKSRPPSPVKEEDGHSDNAKPRIGSGPETDSPMSAATPKGADISTGERRAPGKRRQSLAPSERSVKATRAGLHPHPGVIRLHSTFNDANCLYFVLDLAKNGEMLAFIRKFGSLDIESARYYAAQLIDTIEFMHDRGVIHRDLKPENILLDEEMRIRVTDFGSARILDESEGSTGEDGKKRSFVGSADFVSPEVLRDDPAVLASDTWAFGCVLYQLLVGRPPFRAATDYLTFQKILKRDMDFPDDLDETARSLIDLILNLEPTQRPTPSEIKTHPFFASIDFPSLWTIPVPAMSTGITPPAPTLTHADTESDIWAVFDDEVSDGGFQQDVEDESFAPDAQAGVMRQFSTNSRHRNSPHFDGSAAAKAVKAVDGRPKSRPSRQSSGGSLEPPRFGWAENSWLKKKRGWSTGSQSARTSSSSSNNRMALTGLLETMGISSMASSNSGATSAGGQSASTSGVKRDPASSGKGEVTGDQWSNLFRQDEKVIQSTLIMARPLSTTSSNLIPSFLLPASKPRTLVLTNQARLIEVKDDPDGPGPRAKFEAVFNGTLVGQRRTPNSDQSAVATKGKEGGTGRTTPASSLDGNRFVEIVEKGPKGFVVTTASASVLYVAETVEIKNQWIRAIRKAASLS